MTQLVTFLKTNVYLEKPWLHRCVANLSYSLFIHKLDWVLPLVAYPTPANYTIILG